MSRYRPEPALHEVRRNRSDQKHAADWAEWVETDHCLSMLHSYVMTLLQRNLDSDQRAYLGRIVASVDDEMRKRYQERWAA